jgi:hypothetical protein
MCGLCCVQERRIEEVQKKKMQKEAGEEDEGMASA